MLTTKGWACLELESAKKEHNVNPILLEKHMQIIAKEELLEVVDIIEHFGSFNVYNLEVPEFHTYFANGVVTHNIASK
jgi:intein/homing endonuclease